MTDLRDELADAESVLAALVALDGAPPGVRALADADLSQTPVTRRMADVVASLRIAQDELAYQSQRLLDHLRANPSLSRSTVDHLSDLMRGYAKSAGYVSILRRYQEARVARERLPASQGIDARGIAHAVVDDRSQADGCSDA